MSPLLYAELRAWHQSLRPGLHHHLMASFTVGSDRQTVRGIHEYLHFDFIIFNDNRIANRKEIIVPSIIVITVISTKHSLVSLNLRYYVLQLLLFENLPGVGNAFRTVCQGNFQICIDNRR